MTPADNAPPGLFGWIRGGSSPSLARDGAAIELTALWRTLRADPVAIGLSTAVALLVVVDVAALFLTRGEPWPRLTGLLSAALAVVAVRVGLTRLPGDEKRRFWRKIVAAFVLWILAWSTLTAVGGLTILTAVAVGALFAASYTAFLVAVESPIRARDEAHERLFGTTRTWSGGGLFVSGLFFYFVVIPAALDPSLAEIHLQLFYMLLVLDLYVAGRLFYFGRVAPSLRWRMLYSLLVLMMGGLFLSDLIACLGITGLVPGAGSFSGVTWPLSFLFLVLAARLRHHPFPDEPAAEDAAPEPLPWPRERVVAFALVFPFLHLLFHSAGLVPEAGEQVREAFVLVWLLVFGAKAIGAQHHLEKKTRRLWLERLRAEEAARGDERERRLVQERQDARAALKISEEKFNKALRAIPDAMLISTVSDGRILEVNDSFLRQFGYGRREVLGKTGVELRLWVEPEDRALMTRLLRERGAVRNLAFELTRKSGEKRLMLLSGEIIDLEGATCFLMVLRDVTELESLEVSPL